MSLKKQNISAVQMALMIYPTVLATGFLSLPTQSAQYANNDLWLTSILAFSAGLTAVFLAVWLHRLYPGQTIIEYSRTITGAVPGTLIGFFYCLILLRGVGSIVRQYAEFVTGSFLFKTPILLVISSIMLLAAIAVRGGVEVMARCAVILTPLFCVPFFILLLLIPDLNAHYLLPVLENGFVPVLQASASPAGWFSECFLITFFLPRLTDPGKAKKWGTVAVTVVMLSLLFVDLLTLFLLGPDLDNKIYPVLNAFRYISLADFFENLEALLLAMWVVGNFVKISVFLYAAVVSFTQTLKLRDDRPIVFPLAVWAVIFSFWSMPSFDELSSNLRFEAPFELIVTYIVIPSFLLIIGFAKQRLGIGKQRRSKGAAKS